MDNKNLAQLLILEVKALQEGNYEHRTIDLLTLLNEVVRDAQALAEDTLADASDGAEDVKKAA